MPNTPDGQYDRTKPYRQLPYSYLGPFASNEERLTTQALQAATIPGEELAEMVRPPLPQIDPFRPKFGYRTRELDIADIIEVDRAYNPRVDFSGKDSSIQGTSRDTQGTGTW